jgi:hypothetical protein
VYEGGARVTVSAPPPLADGGDTTGLAGLPLFARAGAVVPMQPVMAYDGARRVDTLALHVFPGTATSELYEDAGDGYAYERGEYRLTTFRVQPTANGGATIDVARNGRFAGAGTFAVTLHAVAAPRAVVVDGRNAAVRYDAVRREATFAASSGVRRIEVRAR